MRIKSYITKHPLVLSRIAISDFSRFPKILSGSDTLVSFPFIFFCVWFSDGRRYSLLLLFFPHHPHSFFRSLSPTAQISLSPSPKIWTFLQNFFKSIPANWIRSYHILHTIRLPRVSPSQLIRKVEKALLFRSLYT